MKNFIRILPEGNSFPYVLPSKYSNFWALKFDVDDLQLKKLDDYEGVPEDLFQRVEIEIILKSNRKSKAFIYIPTKKTILSQNLSLDLDTIDKWKIEIKKFSKIVKKFPELLL